MDSKKDIYHAIAEENLQSARAPQPEYITDRVEYKAMLARKHVANELGQNEKEHSARIVELMRKSANDVNKRRDARFRSQIDVAAELGDSTTLWRLARRLAEMRLGPKGRKFRAPAASPMTNKDSRTS